MAAKRKRKPPAKRSVGRPALPHAVETITLRVRPETAAWVRARAIEWACSQGSVADTCVEMLREQDGASR